MDPVEVTIEVAQDPYLAADKKDRKEMQAVLRVTARPPDADTDASAVPAATGPARGTNLAEVLLIDCSGSMGIPSTKLRAAKHAVRAALDVLPDGTRFAIVRGFGDAEMVYPTRQELATLDAASRAEAGRAVDRVYTSGGTRMSRWLTLARKLLEPHRTSVRHALLLTDGRNEHETAAELTAVLAECSGRFVCDPRGVGDDWDPMELKRVAAELRGTARAVARPKDLSDDFRRVIEGVTGKVVPDLRLRISTNRVDRLAYCRQTYPTMADLAGPQRPGQEGPLEISLGAWGDEVREYHLCFTVDPTGRPYDEDLRVARLDIVADVELTTHPAVVLVNWTTDESRTGHGNESVTFVGLQRELAGEMNAGYAAAIRGDRREAAKRFGVAVKLATELGEDDMLRELSKVVRIVDGKRGAIELRNDVPLSTYLEGSLFSDRARSAPMTGGGDLPPLQPTPSVRPPAPDAGEAPAHCPNPACGAPVPNPTLRFCPYCGRGLTPGPAPDASARPGPDA